MEHKHTQSETHTHAHNAHRVKHTHMDEEKKLPSIQAVEVYSSKQKTGHSYKKNYTLKCFDACVFVREKTKQKTIQ